LNCASSEGREGTCKASGEAAKGVRRRADEPEAKSRRQIDLDSDILASQPAKLAFKSEMLMVTENSDVKAEDKSKIQENYSEIFV
jgi:hypothetical protein